MWERCQFYTAGHLEPGQIIMANCHKRSHRLWAPEYKLPTLPPCKRALMKNRHLSRCMIRGTRLCPAFSTATALVLSQWTSTTRPTQCLPHTTHDSTIGSSSWVVIPSSFIPCPWLAGHCHSPVVGLHAPQPTLLDASVHILTVACCCLYANPVPCLQE